MPLAHTTPLLVTHTLALPLADIKTMTVALSKVLQLRMIGGISKLIGINTEEAVVAEFKLLFRHMYEWTEENHGNFEGNRYCRPGIPEYGAVVCARRNVRLDTVRFRTVC